MEDDLRGCDALIHPARFEVERSAFREEVFPPAEIAAMERYLLLAEELGRCRYFTEEERSMHFTKDQGVTATLEMNLPVAVKKAQGVRIGRPVAMPRAVVSRMRRDRAKGLSYAAIAEKLNAAGVPTAQGGRRWYPATVRYALGNATARR